MSGFFDGVYGARFPDVVMNSGPLPPTGGLPAPLHDTPDGKINYNSTLLGNLQPYAYGEGAYLSTQHSYLNIPHRIQKLVPVIYLPEINGENTFRLSHGIDDGDIAFSMRLNKNSLFCTGTTNNTKRRNGLGTTIDPLINLPTLNYILSCIQMWNPDQPHNKLWIDFLHALDPERFPDMLNKNKRDYTQDRLDLCDLIHIVKNCIRPFGIVRGSEEQGGQDEVSNSPATWPVPFVTTLVIDGKEDHIVNMWHHMDVDSGEDLVLRFKQMPLQKYTLNHYKQPTEKIFPITPEHNLVWQLIPDKLVCERDKDMFEYYKNNEYYNMPIQWIFFTEFNRKYKKHIYIPVTAMSWQELGYWHIGRTQIRMHKYNIEGGSYYHNDMVNALRSQYMMMTFQPTFYKYPFRVRDHYQQKPEDDELIDSTNKIQTTKINSVMTMEKIFAKPGNLAQPLDDLKPTPKPFTWQVLKRKMDNQPISQASLEVPVDTIVPLVIVEENAVIKKANPKRRKLVTGTLIHNDGNTETQTSQTL